LNLRAEITVFSPFFSASFSVKTPGFQKTGGAAKGKPARRRLFLRALFKRDLRGRAAPTFKHTHCTITLFLFEFPPKNDYLTNFIDV